MRPITMLHTPILHAMHSAFSLFSLTSATAPYSIVVFGEPVPRSIVGAHLAVAMARNPVDGGARLLYELRHRAHLVSGWRPPVQHAFIFQHDDAIGGLRVVGWSNGRWSAGSIFNTHHPEVPPKVNLLSWDRCPVQVYPLIAASLDSLIDLAATLEPVPDGEPWPEE